MAGIMALFYALFSLPSALFILHLSSLIYGLEVFDAGSIREYCHLDSFNASCGVNHVILMTSAHYGRMRLGKCLQRGYGAVGCSTDVTSYLDSMCSGRQNCLVNIRDIPVQGFRPCSDELSSYFEGSYTCVPVAVRNRAHCSRHQHYTVNGVNWGFIGSVASALSYSSADRYFSPCPWRIRVMPGQKINLTLYDFSVFTSPNRATASLLPGNSPALCKRYATVQEPPYLHETPICGSMERLKSVYLSESNELELKITDFNINTKHNKVDPTHFLVRYSPVGCPKVASPLNSHVIYGDQSMTVICNSTKEKWYLTCRDNEWVGTVANCTMPDTGGFWSLLLEEWTSPYGILFIVGVGVTLGVIFGALLLICVVMLTQRYRDVCQCFQPDFDTSKYPHQNHESLVTSLEHTSHQTAQPINDKHPDHVLMDYTATHAWLSQRPLPNPDQEQNFLAPVCDEDGREALPEAYSSRASQAFLDSLHPVQYASYPSRTIPAGAHSIPSNIAPPYGPAPRSVGAIQTCYIAGNPHLYESPECSGRTDLV